MRRAAVRFLWRGILGEGALPTSARVESGDKKLFTDKNFSIHIMSFFRNAAGRRPRGAVTSVRHIDPIDVNYHRHILPTRMKFVWFVSFCRAVMRSTESSRLTRVPDRRRRRQEREKRPPSPVSIDQLKNGAEPWPAPACQERRRVGHGRQVLSLTRTRDGALPTTDISHIAPFLAYRARM